MSREQIPEPYATVVRRRQLADLAVFEERPELLEFERDAEPGEFWPFETPAAARCRVYRLSGPLQARALIPHPADEREISIVHAETRLTERRPT